MKQFLLALSLILSTLMVSISCQSSPEAAQETTYVCPMFCEDDKTYTEPGTCPVCKMKLVDAETIETPELADPNAVSDLSIFNLTSTWTTQNNQEITLDELAGKPFVLTMIYTTCQAACPRLVADMRNIEQKVNNPNVRYVLVSIDPENDTPERLKTFAEENQLSDNKWILLHGTLDDVRELSNVVAVKYMRISPLDFSHSNIITVFNAQGELHYQQEGLGVDNTSLVRETMALLN